MTDWSQTDQSSQINLQTFSETGLAKDFSPNDLPSGTTLHAAGTMFNIENNLPLNKNEVKDVPEVNQLDLSDLDSEPDAPPENMGMTAKLKVS
jgi:hypothetical protein